MGVSVIKKIDGRVNNGGARAGAGKPKSTSNVETIKTYYTIKKTTKEAIETLAKDKKSYGAVIDQAVELLMNKD